MLVRWFNHVRAVAAHVAVTITWHRANRWAPSPCSPDEAFPVYRVGYRGRDKGNPYFQACRHGPPLCRHTMHSLLPVAPTTAIAARLALCPTSTAPEAFASHERPQLDAATGDGTNACGRAPPTLQLSLKNIVLKRKSCGLSLRRLRWLPLFPSAQWFRKATVAAVFCKHTPSVGGRVLTANTCLQLYRTGECNTA